MNCNSQIAEGIIGLIWMVIILTTIKRCLDGIYKYCTSNRFIVITAARRSIRKHGSQARYVTNPVFTLTLAADFTTCPKLFANHDFDGVDATPPQ